MKQDANDILRARGPDGLREAWDHGEKEVFPPNRTEKLNGAHGAKTQRFPLVAFDDIQIDTTPNYLIKGLVPRRGLVVFWGPPKCYKSFAVFDLMMHVALGWEYRGRRVRQGTVVYCILEGADGFKARKEAFRQRFLAGHKERIPFHLMATPLSLVADQKALIAAIREQLGEDEPAAIVIDTLNRSFAGSESDDEAMTAYVRASDALRDAFHCAVPVVHHCGLDATRPRGHTSLAGGVEAQIAVKKQETGLVTLTVEFMKDGPEGDVIVSKVECVEVGRDDDGDAITSCVVVPADREEAKSAEQKKPKGFKDKHELALRALDEALLNHGTLAPPACLAPQGTKVVSLDQWREEAVRNAAVKRDAANPREDFKRIRDKLAVFRLIGMRDEKVWRA